MIDTFSSGTYLPLGLLQMMVLCTDTYQTDTKMLLDMTYNLVSNYNNLSYHLLA